jgi:putative phage-type endonuclease
MNIVNVEQGTPEWHTHRSAHFNASDAPAMMGVSKYKTLTQLMHELATGIVPEVDVATQRRFDKGHRLEALARPIAEGIVGEELFPVTGTLGKLSASFDGLTMAENICFEHKTLNNDLRQVKSQSDLPAMYRVQMEQQLLISGADKCLFMASSFDDDDVLVEKVIVWYEPDMQLRKQIQAGWVQFEKDLATYVPAVIVEAPKANVVIELPALFIQAQGEITTSNMREFGEALTKKLAEVRAIALITDQDFSNAEAAAKQFRETCDKLKLAKAQMLEQTVTIGEAARMIDAWHEDLRVTALKLEKDVAAEKEAKKLAIINSAKSEYADYINMLENEIKPIRLNLSSPDFSGAMKGKRLLSAWHDAVSTVLANAKSEADILASDYRNKLDAMRTVEEYKFLFSDLQQIITKQRDDFDLLVTSRIESHKVAEAAKVDAQRVAIQAEADAKVAAEIERLTKISEIECELKVNINQPVVVEAQSMIVVQPVDTKAIFIDNQDAISTFMATREFGNDKNKIRAILVEFVKYQASHNLQHVA